MRIEDFARTYRKVAKQVAKTDNPPIGAFLEQSSLTAYPDVNKHLTWAFRHAVNGEVAHFEACLQDAKNEWRKIKERSLAAMRGAGKVKACCAEPHVRGGRCCACGTWIEELCVVAQD